MAELRKSAIFDSRFVSFHNIWETKDGNDLCYECIDRTDHSSCVVRLERFNGADASEHVRKLKVAETKAVKHPYLCDLKELIYDPSVNVTISVSQNARGNSLVKFVELYSSKPDYPEAVQQILINLLQLYRDLAASSLDICYLPLNSALVIQNSDTMVQQIKVRRPFVCSLKDRSQRFPYNLYETYSAFVDIGAVAYHCFTRKSLFSCESLEEATEYLQKSQQWFLHELFAFETADFDAVETLIMKMYQIPPPMNMEAASSDVYATYDDDDLETCIGDDEEVDVEPEPYEILSEDVAAYIFRDEPDLAVECSSGIYPTLTPNPAEEVNVSFDDAESAGACDPETVFVALNYSMDGLIIKVLANDFATVELNGEILTFDDSNQLVDPTIDYSQLPSNCSDLVADIRTMAASVRAGCEKKLTVTFADL